MKYSSDNEAQRYENGDSVLQLTELELKNSIESKGLLFQRNLNLIVEGSDGTPSEYESTALEDAVAIQALILAHVLIQI